MTVIVPNMKIDHLKEKFLGIERLKLLYFMSIQGSSLKEKLEGIFGD